MNDGRSLEVKHPDFLFLPPGWDTTAIAAFPKGMFEFVYIRNISTIESEGQVPPMPARRRRGGDAGDE